MSSEGFTINELREKYPRLIGQWEAEIRRTENGACAKVAESFGAYQGHGEDSIAAAIRARIKEGK